MRALTLIAGAALALSACGKNDQTDNTQNVDENLTAENIVSNDVTAIDAVTGDAANMAADVNYTDFGNGLDNNGNAQTPARSKRPSAKPSSSSAAPVENSTTTAPANATE